MFGKKMWMVRDGTKITLAPLLLDHAKVLARHLQYLSANAYTMSPDRAQTEWEEAEWIKKTSEDKSTRMWGVFLNDGDEPIGTVGLHGINFPTGNCTSGAMIFDRAHQGKGYGSRFTHPMRTFYAFQLMTDAMFAIRSTVIADNPRSWKALERMGYVCTGIDPRIHRRIDLDSRVARFCDMRHYTCFNPEYIDVLYPEGFPEEYVPALERTKHVLQEARELTQFD